MVQRRLTFASTRCDVDMAYFITPSVSGLKSRSGEGGAEVILYGCKTSLNVLTRANFFDGFSLKGEVRYSTAVALRRGVRGIGDSENGLKTPYRSPGALW